MAKLLICGGEKLGGEVSVSGSKNSALPIIASSLLFSKNKVTLRNVPDIADVRTMINIISSLGAKVEFDKNTLIIDSKNIKNAPLLDKTIKTMRASILLLGPLLARFKEATLAYPGGCVLGKRPIDVHIFALSRLKINFSEQENTIVAKTKKIEGNFIVLPETSVTATENAIMAAIFAEGETNIRLAACEPHVQDLCNFLVKAEAKIFGIGTHNLKIEGVKELKEVDHEIIPDYLESGTLAIAAILSKGEVLIKNACVNDLDVFWSRLREVGANFKIEGNNVYFKPYSGILKPVRELKTAVHPGFPTDLQAPFSVLLTQASGVSRIFETLFEGRLNYLYELEKMGADIKVLNPHEAEIRGVTPLKAKEITSCDIRAGASLVLAALIAKGTTEINNVNYIERGYENLEGKLRKLGAKIEKI